MRRVRIDKERLRVTWEALWLWGTQAFRIARVMTEGAYWMGERKRLMQRLGHHVFEQTVAGKVTADTWKPLIESITELDRRLIRLEERVHNLRFKQPTNPEPESDEP